MADDTCAKESSIYSNRKMYALYAILIALIFLLLDGYIFIS